MGNTTSFTRDLRGNPTQLTDPKGNITNREYNILDQLTGIENPANLRTEYEYTKTGKIKQIKNRNKQTGMLVNASQIAYNELELVKETTDPLGRKTIYEYDKNANPTKIILPNGKDINFTAYDNVDRLTQLNVGTDEVWNYDYDKNSNLKSTMKNGNSHASYSYDKLNRLTGVGYYTANNLSNNTAYAYSSTNKLLSIKHSPVSPSNPATKFEYDINDLNVTVFDSNNGSVSYLYDSESHEKKSFISTTNNNYTSYKEYDTEGKVIKLTTEDYYGNLIVNIEYEYDKNGNVVTEKNIVDQYTVNYLYDNLNQLTREKYTSNVGVVTRQGDYFYEPENGGLLYNRTKMVVTENTTTTTTNFQYNQANELVATGTQYTFDGNGNLTKGSWTYNYNALNQLVRVVSQVGNTIGEYEYNDKRLRSKKTTANGVEYYFYDGQNLAYIMDEYYRLKYCFTRNAAGKLLNMIDCTGSTRKTYWYMLDNHGNVSKMVDDGGAVVVTYRYDAFGVITQSTNKQVLGNGKLLSDENPFRYASYFYDNETKMYYLNARYYMPFMGRFLTKDLVNDPVNRYVYCYNNPVNFVDPSGKFIETVLDVAFAGLSLYQFIKNPTWGNAFYLALDITAVFIPFMVGSYIIRGGKMATKVVSKGTANPQMANKGNSIGRIAANNLNEQLAMKQVQSNPLQGATEVPIPMTDSRWLGTDGWVKMQNIVTLSDGTKVNIHFVFNKALNLVDDFKFK